MAQIGQLDTELREQLERDQLLDNAKPNKAELDGVRGDIERLQAQINDLRTSLTVGTGETQSLAQVTGELRIAEAELATRRAPRTGTPAG